MTFISPIALPYMRGEWLDYVREHAEGFFDMFCGDSNATFQAVCFMLAPRSPPPVVALVDSYDDADQLMRRIEDSNGPPRLPARHDDDDGMVVWLWPIAGASSDHRAYICAVLGEVAGEIGAVAAATVYEAWMRHPSGAPGTGDDVLMICHETLWSEPTACVAPVTAVCDSRRLGAWRDLPGKAGGGMSSILPRTPQGSLDFTPINTKDIGVA